MTAALWAPLEAECFTLAANAAGRQRAPTSPTSAARPMISGNGSFNANSPMNAATAIAHSRPLCSVRAPMRQAAWITMATTAGLTPANAAATQRCSPNAM